MSSAKCRLPFGIFFDCSTRRRTSLPCTHGNLWFHICSIPYEEHVLYWELWESNNLLLSLQVKVQLGSIFQTFLTTSPKYTFASMLSSVGAALNFWSGITIVVVVEILEMCCRMAFLDFNKREPNQKLKISGNKINVDEAKDVFH